MNERYEIWWDGKIGCYKRKLAGTQNEGVRYNSIKDVANFAIGHMQRTGIRDFDFLELAESLHKREFDEKKLFERLHEYVKVHIRDQTAKKCLEERVA